MEPKEFDFEFPRGDNCPLTFVLTDDERQAIDDMTGTNIYFTVKTSPNETSYLFQKTLNGGTITQDGNQYTIMIAPSDTDNLDYGSYWFDVSLVGTNSKTTIIIGRMTLTNEVTFAVNEQEVT